MDLLPTPAQLEIAVAAGGFFADQLPLSSIRARRDAANAIDAQVWTESAALGLFGLALPESIGGVGCDLSEESLLFRELGRRLVPGPYLATVLGARLAALADQHEILSDILSGKAPVGLAQRRDQPVAVAQQAQAGVVDGRFDLYDAGDCRFVLLADQTGAALVETAALRNVTPVPSIDPGFRLASAQAVAAPVVAWLPASTEPVHLRGLVLAAAMSVGIAEATRDMAAEYAKVRVQFGKPIGVHQAIKHSCADMATRAEAALSQLLFATVCVQTGHPDAEFQALAAKSVADRYAVANAAANIQVHGGMGYTYEHDAHLYMKRAHVLEHLLGERAEHLARLLSEPAAQ